MLSNWRFGKTTVSVCACVVSLALFTATSRASFMIVASQELDETISLDSEGMASGVLTVRFDAKNVTDSEETNSVSILESRFDVTGPEARKSLKVSETDVDDDEEKVRTGNTFYQSIDKCWGDEAAPEEVVDCELSVALDFTGKKDAEEPVIFSFEAGSWDVDAQEFEVTLHALTWTPVTE